MPGTEHSPLIQELLAELINATNGSGTCLICGCSEDKACHDNGEPCFWVADDLCSRCMAFFWPIVWRPSLMLMQALMKTREPMVVVPGPTPAVKQ